MSVNLRTWSISHVSSYTFLLALATLVTSLRPYLGSRIVGLRELKAQLGELDTTCNLSSFLKGILKLADVDMDPFGYHIKTDTHPHETGETISLNPG